VIVFSFTAAFQIGTAPNTTALVPIILGLAVLGAITLLRALQNTAFRSIQLASILEQIGQRGREVIDGFYPATLTATVPGPPGSERSDADDPSPSE